MYIIIDACTLIKGITYQNCPEQKIVDEILRGNITAVISKEAVTEYILAPYKIFAAAVNNGNSQLKNTLNTAYNISNKLSDIIINHSKTVNVKSTFNIIAEDPADDKFINLAIDSGVKELISNDTHITAAATLLKTKFGIKLINPFTLQLKLRYK